MAQITDHTPYYVGNTFPAWDIPLLAGGVPDNIFGLDPTKIFMYFRDTSVTNPTDRLGTGVFTIKSTYPAEVYYKPSVGDVANPFTGLLVIKAFWPPSNTNVDQSIWDPIGGATPGSPFVIQAI